MTTVTAWSWDCKLCNFMGKKKEKEEDEHHHYEGENAKDLKHWMNVNLLGQGT